MAISCLASCDKVGTAINHGYDFLNEEDSDDSSEDENVSESEDVSFHDISFALPEGYKLDESISNDDAVYYKVFDDEGSLDKMVYVLYEEGSPDESILADEYAEQYCQDITSGENTYDYSGYRVIDIDTDLSAINCNYKVDENDKTYDNSLVAFNDSDGHIYSICSACADGDSDELLSTVIDTLEYNFEVWQRDCNLKLNVDYEESNLLNDYDVEIYLDENEIGTITQGSTFEDDVTVQKGVHNLIFYRSDNHDVSTIKEINLEELDEELSYSIKATIQSIEIEDYSEEIADDNKANEGTDQSEIENNEPEKSDFILTVKYESNLFLNKYDVDIYVGDEKIGSVAQGNTFKKTVSFQSGQKDMIFCKHGNKKVCGKVSVDLSEGRIYSCSIKAGSKEIEVKNTKTETIAEFNRRKEEAEAKEREEAERKAEEERKAAEEKEARTVFTGKISDCIREKVTSAEKIADKYDYSVRLFNLDRDKITKKYSKFSKAKRKTFRVYKIGKINHDKKYVNLIIGSLSRLAKEEKSKFSSMKKDPLDYAYDQAKEDGYKLIVKNRDGKRIDNKSGFKKKNYVFMSVSKVNYDKEQIVVNADTKKHVAQLEAIARKKAEEAERKRKEEAARKKKEKKEREKQAWLNATVIRTKTGKCYHESWCTTLRSRIPISRRNARAIGLRPCSVCDPDYGHYDW